MLPAFSKINPCSDARTVSVALISDRCHARFLHSFATIKLSRNAITLSVVVNGSNISDIGLFYARITSMLMSKLANGKFSNLAKTLSYILLRNSINNLPILTNDISI